MESSIARALTIAGSAAQGSAGIQADLKTFQERDVYGMAVITAIVANNSTTKKGIFIHSTEEIEAQYYTAIEHVGVDVVKTGMLFSEEIIDLVSNLLRESTPRNLVVDPVMIGEMGSKLLQDSAIDKMRKELFPLATIITPNLYEAALLTNNQSITTKAEMKFAAKEIHKMGPKYVLIKGGRTLQATDILYNGEIFMEVTGEFTDTIHTSGAGCSYSAAIAAELGKGKEVVESVKVGKEFVTMAIKHALSFGKGIGSTYHGALRNKQ